MRKINYLVLLCCVALLTGCAFNRAPLQDYPVLTEVQLNQANFRIVGTAQGYSRQLYIFGIGGISKKSLKENAIMDMFENADLKGSQAIVNITTASTSSQLLPFYQVTRATARGTIIEFLSDNSEPVLNAPSVARESQHVESVPQSVKEDPDMYYIAWLVNTKKFNRKYTKTVKKTFDFDQIEELASTLSSKELKAKAKGHSKQLEKYANK